jgi:hypothetical protein
LNQFAVLRKRIDCAVSNSSPTDIDIGPSEETLTFTKLLVNEEKLLSVALESPIRKTLPAC